MLTEQRFAVRYHETMVRFEEEREMPHMTTAERNGMKKGVVIGRDEGVVIGREEGEAAGRVKEAAASVIEILEARQGEVSAQTAARLAQVTDLDHLRQLRRLLVTGAPIEDFHAHLARVTVEATS